ncbi:hypothetical protein [Parageobacillus toebii]|uniref:hypothetical protein n=1 Tax=Parageobacillus toebii TaxID=153151 RepID=UPI0019677D08|nr:hypothetical protein [Parageobacillus toebii]QSB49931.1 hypothetical protein JTI59_06740 [Parageobacillus toebii]
MNNHFQVLFQSGSGKEPKIWLDFIDYAKRLFAGGKQDLWQDPALLISAYSQAQGLLRSDVIHFPVNQVYASWLDAHSTEMEKWMGKRPTFVLKKMLALEEPRNILLEVLSGFTELNRDAKPFALSLGSPQQWLQWISKMVRPGEDPFTSSDDVDSAAMYIADYLRNFSTAGISAIVLEEAENPPLDMAEALELYQPILNLAGHYQWSVGFSFPGEVPKCTVFHDKVDFTLFGESDMSSLLPYWQEGAAVGGGLNQAFWTHKGDGDRSVLPVQGLLFGTIPEDADPEMVLERLKELRLSMKH